MSGTTVVIQPMSRAAAWSALALALGLFLAVGPRAAQAATSTPQLPNIVADAPSNVSLETSTTEGGLKASGEAKLLLRFNGYIHNVGPGALDFRGYRKSSSEPLKAFQRVYNKDGTYKEEPSKAEFTYVTADGHEHWHLQRVAKYSLWNAAKTSEAAPAMKVGFCLDDSEHVESGIGPKEAVYSDATGREFCREHQPEALNLFEGVSPGWRDLYSSNLAFQWVDASNVLPGEYWLREDVNPTGVIKETGGSNTPAYAKSPTIIPGFDALAQSAHTAAGEPKALTLTSKAWKDSATPKYTIVSSPQHGQLGAVSKNQVTYTPSAGYSGADSFGFSASDPNSPFPRHPAVATMSIEIVAPPAVTIEGAPESMTAGTSVQLSADVTHDSPTVTWRASAGSITAGGLYTAPSEPPVGGKVSLTATTAKGAQVTVWVEITPPPATTSGPPAPTPPGIAIGPLIAAAIATPTLTFGPTVNIEPAAAQIRALLAGQLMPSGNTAKITTLLKTGAVAVVFKALEAGAAVIAWYELPPGAKLARAKPRPVLVASGKLIFSGPGTATIKIKLTAAGRRLLKHAKRIKLTAKGTFTPTGKAPITATRTFLLKP